MEDFSFQFFFVGLQYAVLLVLLLLLMMMMFKQMYSPIKAFVIQEGKKKPHQHCLPFVNK